VRILAIDYGSKRVGIALSDENRRFALPLTVISNTPKLAAEVAKIALQHGAGEIVLGESRNYKGKPNEIHADSLDFKKKLEGRGLAVHFEPEFMTSAQAERLQGKSGQIDASAAALILQSYLDRMNSGE
jgi:putative Holliday junction resolvase